MDNDTFSKIRNFVECLRQFQVSADSLVKALEKELIQSGNPKRSRSRKQKSLWTDEEPREDTAADLAEDAAVTIYSPSQLAKVLGIGRSTMYRLLKAGEIPCVTIANRKRIMGEAVEEYLQKKLLSEQQEDQQ
ncbi:MAG: helix-turn-helix domain-containing protein [Negativicutes bacterium]|nr:helix-turn-helix domain-containing protein [Negativicutes bacterium]